MPTSAPQDPSGYAISSSSISLSWSPPPVLETHGIIREYRINITEQETGTRMTYTSYSTSIDVSLLHPYYTYHWIVTAFTIGDGPYTTFNSVRTLQDGKCTMWATYVFQVVMYCVALCAVPLKYSFSFDTQFQVVHLSISLLKKSSPGVLH